MQKINLYSAQMHHTRLAEVLTLGFMLQPENLALEIYHPIVKVASHEGNSMRELAVPTRAHCWSYPPPPLRWPYW